MLHFGLELKAVFAKYTPILIERVIGFVYKNKNLLILLANFAIMYRYSFNVILNLFQNPYSY